MLDLDRLGPDWNLAANHGMACRTGLVIPQTFTSTSLDDSLQHSKHLPVCECCFNIIHKQPLPLCQNSKQLQFLGFGFPLFFIFLKYVIILLLLQVLSYSVLSVFLSIQSTQDICSFNLQRPLNNSDKVIKCWSWLITFVRTQAEVSTEEMLIRFCSFVIQLLSLIYIRDRLHKTSQYYKQKTTSLSDYSVIITHLPKVLKIQAKIRQFMEQGLIGKHFKAQEIILINQLQMFYRLREQKQQLIAAKQKLMNEGQSKQRSQKMHKLNIQISAKLRQIQNQYDKQIQMIVQDRVICNKAIIVLQTQQIKDQFIEQFSIADKTKLQQYFGNESFIMQIEQAPQPKQIIWENINYPQSNHLCRLALGWSLSIVLITIITVIFFYLLQVKVHIIESQLKKAERNSHNAHQIQIGIDAGLILAMLGVILINKFILSYILHRFTDLERHSTRDEYQFSFGLKYTLSLFFTTAIMTLLVEDVIFGNVFTQQYGVAEDQSIMFFLNSFLVPVIWLINPWQLVKLLKRKYFFGNPNLTQKQANFIMQDARYSMGKRYAQIIQFVWFCFLYSSLIPGGTILMTIGLAIFYWVDKCNLLRRSSINQNISSGLSTRSVTLIDLSLIFRSFGQMLFDWQIRDGVTYQSIICLSIGVVYLLLPISRILSLLHSQHFKKQQKKYSQVKNHFIDNYRVMHPLFARQRQTLWHHIPKYTDHKHSSTTLANYSLETHQDILKVRPHRQSAQVSYNIIIAQT